MGITRELYDRISDYARGKLRQFETYLAKGLSPQIANHYVKEQSSYDDAKKRGLQPWEAYQIWKEFNASKQNSLSQIPTKKSDWIRASSFTQSEFRSPFGYKYLIEIKFRAYNQLTNEWTTTGNTIGLYRTITKGKLDEIIQHRMEELIRASDSMESPYIPQGYLPDMDSIQIVGLYRTMAS